MPFAKIAMDDAIAAVIAAIVLGLTLYAIAVGIRHVWRRAKTAPRESREQALAVLFWCCFVPVLLFFSFFGLVFLLGPIGLVAWVILVFVLIDGSKKYTASRQYGLLWLLTVAAERSMPLTPAIEAFSRERGDSFGRKARYLVTLLNAGVPLPTALERCPGLLPRYAIPTVRVGFDTGTLAQALRRATALREIHEPLWMALQGRLSYLLAVPFFGFITLTFIMLKLVPSFEKIFRDFGTPLPALTSVLINIANLTCSYWFLLLPLWLLAPAILFYLPIRYFGWTDLDLPGMGQFTRRLDSAEILDTLALVAGQQRPMSQGFAALAHSYPKRRIRERLSQVTIDVMMGEDWCNSLAKRGLIGQAELTMLRAAQRVGNLPWALTELAESVRRRVAYRVQAVAEICFPPVIILIGAVILFVVVALFVPLISLITRLAG